IGDGMELDGSNQLRPTSRGLYVNTADSAAVANTTAETNFNLSHTLPAGFLAAGTTIKAVFSGKLSDTGTPQITHRVKFGSTTLIAFGPVNLTGGTDDHFKFEVFIVCTATGTMGNVAVHDIVDRVAGVEQDA
ncbi:hypothetical protein, partial [Burkholderia sp. SIMBA_024]|uniref:hypothetical protein n=1 Tax=Burkholderia sp. SIMBA_024 TaxID=3085768 RepID=UPI003978A8C9